jgi:hypothetical protein
MDAAAIEFLFVVIDVGIHIGSIFHVVHWLVHGRSVQFTGTLGLAGDLVFYGYPGLHFRIARRLQDNRRRLVQRQKYRAG